MQFSVIVPVYNMDKYLLECIQSLKAQTFSDFEVILVDDGSTDRSSDLCDEIAAKDTRFNVLHKKNGGLISARRTGLSIAKGTYILFCDADDMYCNNTLEDINNIINSNYPDLIVFNALVFNEKSEKPFSNSVFDDGLVDKKCFIDEMFESYSLNSMCMKAIRKDIIDIARNYSDFYKCNFGEDLLQSVPIVINAKKIYYTNKQLYRYRLESGMMRKYAPNYYWSYRYINKFIFNQLNAVDIKDAELKTSIHLIKVTYGAIVQAQFAEYYPKNDWNKIRQDMAYKNALKTCTKYQLWHKFSKKERVTLILWRCGMARPLYLLLKIKKVIKR